MAGKRRQQTTGDLMYGKLPLPYPLCRGVPRPHAPGDCVHCQNFIRTRGPEIQQLVRIVNRLVDKIESLEERLANVAPTAEDRARRAAKSTALTRRTREIERLRNRTT